MKILAVLVLSAILMGLAFLNQDRITLSGRLENSHRASVAHELELVAGVRRVLEQPASCDYNLTDVPFDPVAIAAGGISEVPSIALAGGSIASRGEIRGTLRTSRIAITSEGFADLGPGPAGMHRYQATLRVETEKTGTNFVGTRKLSSSIPLRVCVDSATKRILSCDPCPAAVPSPSPSASPSCPPGPFLCCSGAQPRRCRFDQCTFGSPCAAWVTQTVCVSDCTSCEAYENPATGDRYRSCN